MQTELEGAGSAPDRLQALHLFANFKWTGPADPAIRTARDLRRLGADVLFTRARYDHGQEHWFGDRLRHERLPVTGDLELPKHYRPMVAWKDSGILAARLRRGDFNLLHANLPSDHLTAALAKRRAGRGTRLVRTLFDPEAPPRNLRNRFAFAWTDGVVVPTQTCADQMGSRFRVPPERILLQEPTMDAQRFAAVTGSLRETWGVGADHVLVGITARVQPHRRFDLLWDVARRVCEAEPRTRFVLLGRGSEEDLRNLVHDPIRKHELGDHVILPGYLEEPDYTRALKSLDLFTFLVPGSDGTCRAAREAIAAGLPLVTTKRGILPELVSRRHDGIADDPCGLAIEEEPELMANALLNLVRDPGARARLRAGGAARVAKLMDEKAAAKRLLAFYRELLGTR